MLQVVPFAIVGATAITVVVGYRGCEPPARPAPDEIVNRAELPSCGEAASRPVAEPEEPLTRTVLDCLIEGRGGRGAEFALTQFTTDGDPIVYYLRTPAGVTEIEVLVDTSQDRFGGGPGWRRTVCTVPELSAGAMRDCMYA